MTDLGNKTIMAQNIQFYLDMNKLSRQDLCNALGFKYSTLSAWLTADKYPRIDKIEMMANYFKISKADLVENKDRRDQSVNVSIQIPVLGTVAAGVPMYAAENIIDEEEISAEMAHDGEYFGLVIKGQSMEPKLYEGDVVIVRKQDYIENGETAIILINGDEATCKLVKEMPDGIMLIGHNTAVYEPHFYSREEIDRLPVKVIGKVVELRRKF